MVRTAEPDARFLDVGAVIKEVARGAGSYSVLFEALNRPL